MKKKIIKLFTLLTVLIMTFPISVIASNSKTPDAGIEPWLSDGYAGIEPWLMGDYCIEFYSDYKESNMEIKGYSEDGTNKITLPSNMFTKKGYKFKGWAISSKDAKAGKVKYKNKAVIKTNELKKKGTLILYAVWEKK